MNIAICEDNNIERRSLTDYIAGALDKWRIHGKIQAFSNGEELLVTTEQFSVYFLDIYLAEIDGVRVAYEIRRNFPKAMIIFTTSSPDYMAEGFDVGAVHYLLKPITKAAVETAMERVLQLTHEYERYVTLQLERIHYKVLLSSIVMAESKDKYCIITTENEVFRIYMKMSELETLLNDERFLRCHRSFLINMDYAVGIENKYFKMVNHTMVPVKRDHQLKMKQYFCEYCFAKLRREMR